MKGVTVADAYIFGLKDELKVLAENELRETNATRSFALTALREWIESNPRIAAARLGNLRECDMHVFAYASVCLSKNQRSLFITTKL